MLRNNPSRKDDAIAFENVKYILKVHGAFSKEITGAVTPFSRACELRKEFPGLGVRDIRDKMLEEKGILGMIFVVQSGNRGIYISESEAGRLASNLKMNDWHDLIREVLHAAYCGCYGCARSMKVLCERT